MEKMKYYPYLDTLKGIAILLMVMGHVIPWTLGEADFLHCSLYELHGNQFFSSLVYKIIYSFHMPLLFFVSGFLFYKSGINHDRHYLKDCLNRRVHRILIPYLMTGSLLWIGRGHWGYWFLQCLFFLNVIVGICFYLTDTFSLKKQKEIFLYLIVFVVLFLIGKLLPNLESSTNGIVVIGKLVNFYPAFLMGVLFRKYDGLKQFFQNDYCSTSCLILYLVLFSVSCIKAIPYFTFISSFVMPLCMIVFLNALFVNKTKLWGGVNIVGKYSLEIYILHIFYVMVFNEVGTFILTIDSIFTNITFQIVYSFILSVVAIILSILTADFLKGSKALKRLLFGL